MQRVQIKAENNENIISQSAPQLYKDCKDDATILT